MGLSDGEIRLTLAEAGLRGQTCSLFCRTAGRVRFRAFSDDVVESTARFRVDSCESKVVKRLVWPTLTNRKDLLEQSSNAI